MGRIEGNIGGGTPPFGIVVRKEGENSGNRCLGSCNNLPVNFTHDNGDNVYYFTVVDSNNCTIDSRVIGGGLSNVNCDVVQPNFIASMQQPYCSGGNVISPQLVLSAFTNATRYNLWYDSVSNEGSCTSSTGTIPGSGSVVITMTATNADRPFWVKVYNGPTCESYKIYSDFIAAAPICVQPCAMTVTLGVPLC